MTDEPLSEYREAVAKIDDAVARISAVAQDALACRKGCASCCVGGLSVLPVEAAAIRASGLSAPLSTQPGMCAMLDTEGACSIYAARPVLCRTHGLPWLQREASATHRIGLRVLEGISVCALNFTARAPAAAEVLDAEKLMLLLATVDARYQTRIGAGAADAARVLLSVLALGLPADPPIPASCA